PLKPGVIFHSVPSKASLVMACERPVIMIIDKNSKYGEFINSEINNTIFSHDELEKVKNNILELSQDKLKYKDLSCKAFNFAKDYFTKERNIKIIYNVLINNS